MKRIILSLILLFPLFLFAQPTSSTETDASDNGELFENIMKLIESPDYSSPQREFALETIRQFQEMAASPDFNPVEFEKYASELIDSLVETYQFIAASVIIQYAYQILLPYYNGPDWLTLISIIWPLLYAIFTFRLRYIIKLLNGLIRLQTLK